MYNVKDFLNSAMTNTTIVIIDAGIRHIITVDKIIKEEYNDRTFSCWNMECDRLTLYLD